MKLKDAKAQIEREHPELHGREKIEAIKALREAAASEEAQEPAARPGSDVHCRNCQQNVKPTVHNGWGDFFYFLVLMELAAVMVSILATFRRPHLDVPLAQLALWPASIHPSGLGVVAAIAALLAASSIAGALTRRAERAGTCPKCNSVLADQEKESPVTGS